MNYAEQIDSALENFKTINKKEAKKRLESEITTGEHYLSGSEYFDLLYKCMDAIGRNLTDTRMLNVAILQQRDIMNKINSIASHYQNKENAQDWHQEIIELERLLHQSSLFSGAMDEEDLKGRTAELRNKITSLNELDKRLHDMISLAEALEDKVNVSSGKEKEIKALLVNSTTFIKELESNKEVGHEHLEDIKRIVDNSKENSDQIGALSEKIKLFFETVDEYDRKIKETQKHIGVTRDQITKFLDDAQVTRKQYESEVINLIEMAVGASLFKAFGIRQKQHGISKWVWAAMVVISMCASVTFAFHLANVAGVVGGYQELTASFWVKLSTMPLFVLVVIFFAKQYAMSMKFEEIYAFKSALSISLEPYKKLVMEMFADEKQKQHLDFVVETIRQIYSPITVELEKDSDSGHVPIKAIEQIMKLFNSLPK